MTTFWKKKQFWGALIAVALLAYCVKDISVAEIRELLERINLYYLIPAVLCSFAFQIGKAIRWRSMVGQNKTLPVMRGTTLYGAGQVLGFAMPALTGQVARMFLFARKEGLRKTFVFSTMVMEVLFDAVALIIFIMMISVAFVFPDEYRVFGAIIGGVTLVALVAFYVVLHYHHQFEDNVLVRIRERRPSTYITLKKFLRSFVKGIEMLRSSQHMFGTIAISVVSWACHILVVYFLFRSFGFELPIAAAAAIMIINTIVLMVPITPGNAGTFEVAVSTSLKAFSIGGSDAVLFALALHLVDLLPIFVMGLSYFRFARVSIREIRTQHEDDTIFKQLSEDGTVIEEEKV
jgi:uncharacterized protein (TIRG00374 family)